MDGRKNNGGHSTKTAGKDKRKNEYRKALDKASTVEDVVDVICMVREKALEKKRHPGSKGIFRILSGQAQGNHQYKPR